LRRNIVFVGIALLAIGIVAILFSLVQIPFTEQEPYDVPQSSNIINESFVVPVGETRRTASLNEGDLININFRVTSGGNLDVDFFVVSGQDYIVSLSRVTNYNNNITIPSDSTVYFIWDNSFSWITQKGVTATITKIWNEIAYRDVTVYHTVVPSEYASYVEYLGIALVLAGIAVISWGYASKTKTDTNQSL